MNTNPNAGTNAGADADANATADVNDVELSSTPALTTEGWVEGLVRALRDHHNGAGDTPATEATEGKERVFWAVAPASRRCVPRVRLLLSLLLLFHPRLLLVRVSPVGY